jgi:P27 family predicted phage terminase small subunit
MKPKSNQQPPPPKHLKRRSKEFWKQLNERFVFESHDLERLRVTCEAMDTVDECEAAIRRDGLITKDRYGQAKTHPAFAAARDARQLVLRGLRELCVDVESPEEVRLPRQTRRYK